MSNPSIIHRLLGVIHRFGTLPPKQNLPKTYRFRMQPALISARQPSGCRPYSSDNRQVKGQNRPNLLLIRQPIVNQHAVIVKWINGSNRPIIDRRDIIIDRSTMFQVHDNLKMIHRNRQSGWFLRCLNWPSNLQSILTRIAVFISLRLLPVGVRE